MTTVDAGAELRPEDGASSASMLLGKLQGFMAVRNVTIVEESGTTVLRLKDYAGNEFHVMGGVADSLRTIRDLLNATDLGDEGGTLQT